MLKIFNFSCNPNYEACFGCLYVVNIVRDSLPLSKSDKFFVLRVIICDTQSPIPQARMQFLSFFVVVVVFFFASHENLVSNVPSSITIKQFLNFKANY